MRGLTLAVALAAMMAWSDAEAARDQTMPDQATRERVADWMDLCTDLRIELMTNSGTESAMFSDGRKLHEFLGVLEIHDDSLAAMAREYIRTCWPITERIRELDLPCGQLARELVTTVAFPQEVIRAAERYLGPESGLDETARRTVENYLRTCVATFADSMDGKSPDTVASVEDEFAEPEVESAHVTMWALKRSNLRSGPGTDHAKVGLLEIGDEVRVSGEIGEWLRIEAPGVGEAFVYAPLLTEDAPRAMVAGGPGVETGSVGGASGTPAGQADWLLPGTAASASAGKEALASPLIGFSDEVRVGVYQSGEPGSSTQWVPNLDDGGDVRWGDWRHSSLSGRIPKYQHILQHAGHRSGEIDKHVVGVLDKGIFSVAYDSIGGVAWQGGYWAFALIEADNTLFELEGSGRYPADRRDIFYSGATWNGDALGIERSSREIVYGRASLTVTKFVPGNARTPSGNEAGIFGYRFEVVWNNGDRVQYSFVHTHLEYEDGPRDDLGRAADHFYGAFMGRNAGEAFGAFRTSDYHGSFGLQRNPQSEGAGASLENPLSGTPGDSLDFGDDASEWAHDGECDDPRFVGDGMAEALLAGDKGRDAADPLSGTPGDSLDFGDDASEWAHDGECDDPRFVGDGMAEAETCRGLFEQGRIRLKPQFEGAGASLENPLSGTPGDSPDFGDDASEWAHDGECDDPRFVGDGMAETLLAGDMGRDAADCRGLFEQGRIRLKPQFEGAGASLENPLSGTPGDSPDFGDDASEWAHDGECDDPRFVGDGMAETLLAGDMGRDAADCRGLFEQGRIRLKPQFEGAGASLENPLSGTPGDSPDFGDDASEWAHDGECDDPRFVGDGMAETLLAGDMGRDAADCRGLFEQGRIRLKPFGS